MQFKFLIAAASLVALLSCNLHLCGAQEKPTVKNPVQSTPSPIIKWAGHEWLVKNRTDLAGPGPNVWDARNVWVDDKGSLHLKLAQRDGKWSCAEISSLQRFGFGRYNFKIEGPVDRLDPQVVLGLFSYPTSDVGPNGTHEIDIEFARWGKIEYPIGNYSVWPTQLPPKSDSHTFPVTLNGTFTTHRWTWLPDSISFQSQHGHRDDDNAIFAQWKFAPTQPVKAIAQKPMPMHFNLWLFGGEAPTDGREIEIVIRDFRFEPLADVTKKSK